MDDEGYKYLMKQLDSIIFLHENSVSKQYRRSVIIYNNNKFSGGFNTENVLCLDFLAFKDFANNVFHKYYDV